MALISLHPQGTKAVQNSLKHNRGFGSIPARSASEGDFAALGAGMWARNGSKMNDDQALDRAAQAIAAADALLIGAGAGMGVDSGLPDFRGNQGFWKAYPAYAR